MSWVGQGEILAPFLLHRLPLVLLLGRSSHHPFALKALFQHPRSRTVCCGLLWGVVSFTALAVPSVPWVSLEPVLTYLGSLVGGSVPVSGP